MKFPVSVQQLFAQCKKNPLLSPFTFNFFRDGISTADAESLLGLVEALRSQRSALDETEQRFLDTVCEALSQYATLMMGYINGQFNNTDNAFDQAFVLPIIDKSLLEEGEGILKATLSAMDNLYGLYLHHNQSDFAKAIDVFHNGIDPETKNMIYSEVMICNLFHSEEMLVAQRRKAGADEEEITRLKAEVQTSYELLRDNTMLIDESKLDSQGKRNLATIYCKMGQYLQGLLTFDIDVAKSYFAKAFTLWPESNVMCNNYGIFLFKFSLDVTELKKAEQVFQRVIDRDPEAKLLVARNYQVQALNKRLTLQSQQLFEDRYRLGQRHAEMRDILQRAEEEGSYSPRYIAKKRSRLDKNLQLSLLALTAVEVQASSGSAEMAAKPLLVSDRSGWAKRKHQQFTGMAVHAALGEAVERKKKKIKY